VERQAAVVVDMHVLGACRDVVFVVGFVVTEEVVVVA
jgi:hypothetical protein